MSKAADIDHMIDVSIATYRTIDILVNNAGIMDDFSPAGDVSDHTWERVMAINTTGPLKAMRKLIPMFLQKSRCHHQYSFDRRLIWRSGRCGLYCK